MQVTLKHAIIELGNILDGHDFSDLNSDQLDFLLEELLKLYAQDSSL